jgi:serine/threonine protein kinase
VDERADVWSLGVILYVFITGRLPFEGRTAWELRRLVREKQPDPPSKWRSDIDPALERVILSCLEKDPLARMPGVTKLRDALAPFRLSQPPHEPPLKLAPAPQPGPSLPRVHARPLTILTASAALVVTIAFVMFLLNALGALRVLHNEEQEDAGHPEPLPAGHPEPSPVADVRSVEPASTFVLSSATPLPSAAPQASAQLGHAPQRPSSPSSDDAVLRRALLAPAHAAKGCKKEGGPTGRGTVRVSIAPSGTVESATFEAGPFEGTIVGRCILNWFKSTHVSGYEGPSRSFSQSFSIE